MRTRSIYIVSVSCGNIIGGAETELPLVHLGLLSIEAYQRERGFDTKLLDGDSQVIDDRSILDILIDAKPLLVGFSPVQVNMHRSIRIIRELKRHCPATTVALGGHHASFVAEDILSYLPEVDVIVRGDGEVPFANLTQCLIDGDDWRTRGILGLVFRSGRTIVETGASTVIDMDSLPSITEHQLARKNGQVAMVTSRGCQGSCSFCASPGFRTFSRGSRWRVHSPERVVGEIQDLAKCYDQRKLSIHFHDADFMGLDGAGIARATRIAELLLERKLDVGIRFACQARTARKAGEDFWRLWKKAGLVKAYIGFESGNNLELRRHHKASSVQDNIAAYSLLRSCDVGLQVGFIMFTPYSSKQMIEENLNFLSKVDQAHLFKHVSCSLQIYPGTRYFDILRKQGLLEFEKPYLEIRALYEQSFAGKLKKALAQYQENQYPQDCLCLDLDFAVSSGLAQVQVLGGKIDLSTSTIKRFRAYRQIRASILQSSMRRMLKSDEKLLLNLAKNMDRQLTQIHKEFLPSMVPNTQIEEWRQHNV